MSKKKPPPTTEALQFIFVRDHQRTFNHKLKICALAWQYGDSRKNLLLAFGNAFINQ